MPLNKQMFMVHVMSNAEICLLITKEEIIPMVMILHNNEGQIILITVTLTCNNTMHEHFLRKFEIMKH